MTDTHAKRALILGMLEAWPSGNVTSGTDAAYAATVENESLEAVTVACAEFSAGTLDRDHRFAPTGAEFAQRVRLIETAIDYRDRRRAIAAGDIIEPPKLVSYPMGGEPPPGYVAMGPIEVSFDGGARIDMREMTPRQREYVMEHKRRPPSDAKHLGVQPRLQRMGGT
jgi:hypothetical protein